MTIEAMKQALEALEKSSPAISRDFPAHGEAIKSLRQAIEQAEKQEPVASAAYDKIDRFLRNNLDDIDYEEYVRALDRIYTAPQPQREWVGLTDKEMLECNMDGDFMIDRETAKRNVEAKLKEKNT